MKKILLLLAFATFTITSTFAITTTSDIQINGSVNEKPYTFSLSLDGAILTDGDTLTTKYDLSTVSKTNNFIVQRSAGNLKQSLGVTVRVDTYPFIGSYDGNQYYNTGLYPTVTFSSDYTYSSVNYNTNKTVGAAYITIPAGPNLTAADFAGFYLDINGNSRIPAGDFVSTIKVTYTYV